MKTKPILFNTEMVQAILRGEKTCTRRFVIEGKPPEIPGNLLWVKETSAIRYRNENGYIISYRADEDIHGGFRSDIPSYGRQFREGRPEKIFPSSSHTKSGKLQWHPSLFMPRWANRITLVIVSVQKENLQDITDAEAIREGFTSRAGFRQIWVDLYGQSSWEENPEVWSINFKPIFENIDIVMSNMS